MKNNNLQHWLSVANKINSIAQSGLTYTTDKFDQERYRDLLELSIRILEDITSIDSAKLNFVFNREKGYQTPKVGVRAVIVKNKKILLVKEMMDDRWSLPGGWADTGLSPGEAIVSEVKEETGYDVRPMRILGLIHYNRYQTSPFPFDVYQLFMECEIIGGTQSAGTETTEVDFFDIDALPEISHRRVTKKQIVQMYSLSQSNNTQPVFD
jgi:ADP-ribose pyrophosphatase YjhB (NUDIX family)